MVDVPSFISRAEFYGAVLPGYIAVILVVVFFVPQFLPVTVEGTSNNFSVDFFTAIVFIVAGPAVGYSLRQFHRYIYTFISLISNKAQKKSKKAHNVESERERAVRQYAEIRINSNSEQKTELDQSEASYDFSVSTAIILLSISVYHIVVHSFSLMNLPMLVISIFFFFGAVIEKRESYEPTLNALASKYGIK